MNRWILLAALAALASVAQANTDKIVCYFGSWAVYRPGQGKFDVEDIDPTLCTHLIFSFIGLAETGHVRVLDSWNELSDNYGKGAIGRFVKLCKNTDTKCLIAMGGWNEGSARYSTMAASPALRKNFVESTKDFCLKHGFDGLDLDWEYPNQRGGKPEDKDNFSILLKETKAAYAPHGLLLTAAVGAAESSASQSYDIAEISKHLDFINIMSYDLHGSWEKQTGHNAPLYPRTGETGNDLKLNVDECVNYWLNNGCPPHKLIVGVPFYARTFTLADRTKTGLGAPTTGPGTAGQWTRENGMFGYNEICVALKQGGWTVVRDKEHRTPYAYKDNQWMGYDDVTSLMEKTDYIKKRGLGGAMMWSIETDDFNGLCGEKYPLLKTLNAGIRGTIPPPRPNPDPTDKPQTERPPVTQPPTAIPGGVCKKEGFVRDDKDCSVFYQCVNNHGTLEPHKFNCAPGLVFNTKINACDFKDNVQDCPK
ncbi:chitinase-3-like protein 1 isoform X2 [Odontomachus brunneus]|nr:chitinase-3-like protein 1 isoform X2 [Odontomachus brunneus]